MQQSVNEEVLNLRAEHDAFAAENILMLKRIEKIDWDYTGIVKLGE